MATSILDNDVLTGITLYNVLAVDETGNESAYATIQVVMESSKTDYGFSD